MKKILFLVLFINFLFADSPVERVFKGEYKKAKGHKALAIAVNNLSGLWAYGYSSNQITTKLAKEFAYKNCMKAARKHNVGRQCKLYAVNNRKLSYLK